MEPVQGDPQTQADFRQLIERIQGGSTTAVQELLNRYGSYLLLAVRKQLNRKLRSKYDSHDFVQDVWASFFKKSLNGYSFQHPNDLAGFLMRLARNKVVNVVRQRLQGQKYNVNRECSLHQMDYSLATDVPDDGQTPSQILMRQEEWDLLLRAQPPVYRRVLVLYRQGLDAAAIAREMNVHVRTINRILAKVRQQQPRLP